jgi:hypothetical protein
MGWWNWLLGLLHFLCSPIDEASTASTGMVSIHCEPQREKVCVFRVYETVSFPFVFLKITRSDPPDTRRFFKILVLSRVENVHTRQARVG